MVECMLHMHVFDKDRFEFRDEFLLRRGECKTREIPISGIKQNRNFDYNIVNSIKNP